MATCVRVRRVSAISRRISLVAVPRIRRETRARDGGRDRAGARVGELSIEDLDWLERRQILADAADSLTQHGHVLFDEARLCRCAGFDAPGLRLDGVEDRERRRLRREGGFLEFGDDGARRADTGIGLAGAPLTSGRQPVTGHRVARRRRRRACRRDWLRQRNRRRRKQEDGADQQTRQVVGGRDHDCSASQRLIQMPSADVFSPLGVSPVLAPPAFEILVT
jgi:hypothetical protein